MAKKTTRTAPRTDRKPKREVRKTTDSTLNERGGFRGGYASASRKPGKQKSSETSFVEKKDSAFSKKRQFPSRRTSAEGLTIFGLYEIEAALANNFPIKRIVADESFLPDAKSARISESERRFQALFEKAESLNVSIEYLSKYEFASLFGEKNRRIAALADSFPYTDLGEALAFASEESSVIVALDHVEDPGNLGAIIRTAEAMGALCVLIPKDRAAQMTEAAIRTSQGAAFVLPVCRVTNLARTLASLKEEGYWIAGLDMYAEQELKGFSPPAKTVLALGGEDAGLSRSVMEQLDFTLRIPLKGKTPSLNVSAAAAMALYEVLAAPSKAEK